MVEIRFTSLHFSPRYAYSFTDLAVKTSKNIDERLKNSSKHFWIGLQPALNTKSNLTIQKLFHLACKLVCFVLGISKVHLCVFLVKDRIVYICIATCH